MKSAKVLRAGTVPSFTQFRILKDTIGYSASAVVGQSLGLVAGFWIARILGPSDFGIWNAVSLVLAYGAYAEFGVLSAMGRDLPFHRGQGDQEKAAALEGAARWATIAGAALAAAVVMAASFLPVLASQPPMVRTGLRLMAIILILQQVYTYHRTVLRAHNLFGELSQQQVLLSVLNSGLAVAGVIIFGLFGRLTAALLAQAAILLYALSRNPWRSVPRFDARVMWSLMRVGIPITASGSILSLVTTVDRPMVIQFLGETQLGYFGLALLLTSLVSLVPGMASQVLYPRITYQFGQSGRNVAALRSLVLTPPLVLACLLPLVIGPLYVAMPLVIRLLLPAFVPAITATRIVLVGIFFYSILGVTDYFLVTTGKLKQFALFGGVTLTLNIAFDYLALRLGYGITGVAFAGTPLTYFIYSTIVIGYALSHYTREASEWIRYFSRLWLPFGYMLTLLWALDVTVNHWIAASTPIGLTMAAVVSLLTYWVGMLPLAFLAARTLKMDLSLASLSRLRQGQ